jgi:hypothetical protein
MIRLCHMVCLDTLKLMGSQLPRDSSFIILVTSINHSMQLPESIMITQQVTEEATTSNFHQLMELRTSMQPGIQSFTTNQTISQRHSLTPTGIKLVKLLLTLLLSIHHQEMLLLLTQWYGPRTVTLSPAPSSTKTSLKTTHLSKPTSLMPKLLQSHKS